MMHHERLLLLAALLAARSMHLLLLTTTACSAAPNSSPWSSLQTLEPPARTMHHRTKYLEKTLSSLAELPGLDKVTVYISQDGEDMAVKDVIHDFGQGLLAPPKTRSFEHWQRKRLPQLGPDQASVQALFLSHVPCALRGCNPDVGRSHW